MTTFLKKYSILIPIIFIVVLFLCAWLFPPIGILVALTFLLFSLVIMTYSITEKHRRAYLKGNITKIIFLRNTILEITIILLAMLLAALLGNYLSRIATGQITSLLIRFIVGIIIGLLVGIVVGVFVKRTWEKIQLYFSKAQSQ